MIMPSLCDDDAVRVPYPVMLQLCYRYALVDLISFRTAKD